MRLLLLSVLILCLWAKISFAQEPLKPVLADEFEKIGCEEFLSRMDGFLAGITMQGNSTGTVVLYGDSSNLSRNYEYEAWTNGNAAFRNFPTEKLKVLRRQSADQKVQFWIVPLGSDIGVAGEEWSMTLPAKTRPFIFWEWNEGGCPGNPRHRFAQVLTANPNARANIVLRGNSIERRKARKELVDVFVNSFGIARNRLRFYPVQEGRHLGFASEELWIVP